MQVNFASTYLSKTVCSFAPHFHVGLCVLYRVCERLARGERRVSLQRHDSLQLRRDITLMTQLVLPLVVRLLDHDTA